MDIKPDWTLGTLTLTAGSTAFTTTGSALKVADIQGGDTLMTQSGAVLVIETITGENSGTLYMPCPASAAGYDQPLRVRYQGDASRLPAATRDLVNMLSSGNLSEFSQLQGDIDKVPYFLAPGVLGLIDLSSLGGGGTGKGAWNALVGTLAGRAAYNNETEGFRVLVADNGSGQAVIYQKTGAGTVDWSMPIPFTGAKGNDGQPNKLTVGSVIEGDETRVTITGTSPNQIVNFVLRRGEKGVMGDVTPEALAAKLAAEAAAVKTADDRLAVDADRKATLIARDGAEAAQLAAGIYAQTATDKAAQTTQDATATAADRVATAADRVSASESAATATTKAAETVDNAAQVATDRDATGQDRIATAADRVATGRDRVAANTSADNAAASEAGVAADARAAQDSAAAGLSYKRDAETAALFSDERATVATAAAAETVEQVGIATAAAIQTASDRLATAEDRTAVAADKLLAQNASATSVSASEKANAWANAPEGQEVEAGQFSARHYAKQAENAAGDGVKTVNGHAGVNITLEAEDVWAAAINHGHADATGTAAGFMSAADKAKVDALPANADKTNMASVGAALASPTPTTELVDGDKIGGVGAGGAVLKTWSWATIKAGIKLFTDTLYASKGQGAKADTALQTLLEGSNITIEGAGTSRKISASGVQSVNNKSEAHITLAAADVGASPTNHGHADATGAAAGFMSAADKAKVDALPANADKTNTATVGSAMAAAAGEQIIADTDSVAGVQSGTSNMRRWTWGIVKAWIKGWITKADIGLSLVDNTSDANKPVSMAQAAADGLKVNITGGAGLGGFTALPYNLGDSSGVNITPVVGNGNFQDLLNTGACTISAPANGTYDIRITFVNAAGSAAPIFVGFNKVNGSYSAGKSYFLQIQVSGSIKVVTMQEVA